MDITYRIAVEEDIEAMAKFWSDNAGWDIIDAVEWKRRFMNSPAGDAIVSLALDESTSEIIGQFVFIPLNVSVAGKTVKAFRPFAPILKVSLQTKFGISALLTGRHPLLKMYARVTEDLSKKDIPFVFIIPDPRWNRVLKAFPNIMTHRFPLWTLSLPLTRKFEQEPDYISKKIASDSIEIDEIWQKAALTYTAMIVRNRHLIRWRTQFGDFKTYAVYKGGNIVGFFAAVYKSKDHQWLICDLIAADTEQSLKNTLLYACNILADEDSLLNRSNEAPRKLSILATPPIEKVLLSAGFVKNDYHFTLAVHALDKKNIDRRDVNPANWYISAND